MRIIAGSLRGRSLSAPRGWATRPTSDRVREALFSILGDVADLEVLDLYAGSGALGLEALSRGARSAVFVEEAREALAALERNLTELGVAGAARVLPGGVCSALRRLGQIGQRFGLVFLDPPYESPLTSEVTAELARGDVLAEGAWVVLEHAARTDPPAGGGRLALRFTSVYGDTALTFYRYSSEAP